MWMKVRLIRCDDVRGVECFLWINEFRWIWNGIFFQLDYTQSTVRSKSWKTDLLVNVTTSNEIFLLFYQNKGLPFGLFWNCLPAIKWFGHLAFFESWRKCYLLRPVLEKSEQKLPNNLKICPSYFTKIWSFSIFVNLTFSETACLWPNLGFLIFLDLATLAEDVRYEFESNNTILRMVAM